MEQRRFVIFIVLSVALLIGNLWFQSVLRPKQPVQPAAAQKQDEKGPEKKGEEVAKDENQKPPDQVVQPEIAPGANPVKVADEPEIAPKWLSLGSADPSAKNPYRMLALFTNRGAAVERIEMASAHYRDMEDRSGYLGHLALEDAVEGIKINVVGQGTPAADAGLKAGDVIKTLGGKDLQDAAEFVDSLSRSETGDKIELTINRAGQPQAITATLARRPLQVVRPEVFTGKMELPKPLDVVGGSEHDPFSFLLTLAQVGDSKLPSDAKVDDELDGVKLRTAYWEGKQVDDDTVEFTKTLPKFGLEIVKRFQIAKIDPNKPDAPAYHLTLEVELRNIGDVPKKVAYQLDGPTGLPIEGWWYATRISRSWGGAGVRDTAMLLHDADPTLFSPAQIEKGIAKESFLNEDLGLLVYAGVDAQYFASALLPTPQKDRVPWLAQVKPILVGAMPKEAPYKTLGDVSCRLVSMTKELKPLKPGDEPLVHRYTIFAGPKQPDLLAQYPLSGDPTNNLGELIYYGWPIWAIVARPMTHILHFFYSIVGNYGLAIVMLTVLVRGCMFPLSRKQALGAQKMQELKPEMDKINEKFKSKPEEKTRAMQELWRKHNYNPMSGCMVAFLQLPIFIGLYRALMINVELRQTPLLGESIHWCSNLAAPDMLFYWKNWSAIPSFLTAYKGFMSLGPYLNILPLFTVGLFILQQQMFMPPATDDQTRMQQKMMKYMMVFIGYMFYTVPSGLCLYIISSSIWAICEKKLLPKATAKSPGAASSPSILSKLFTSPEENGTAAAKRSRKKQRGR